MMSLTRATGITAVLLACLRVLTFGQDGYDLLQQGLLQERTYGDLERAAVIYNRIVAEANVDEALAATALVRLGGVYEKLGMSEARVVYLRVIRDFADLLPQVEAAREQLARLSSSGARRGRPNVSYTLIMDEMPVGRLGSPASYDFSPDGMQVVFRSHARRGRSLGLYIADSDGTSMRPLIVLDSVNGPTEGLWVPRWSPDGTRIAFLARYPGWDQTMGVYVADAEGDSVQHIGESLGGDLCWMPDGSGVIHVGARSSRLQVLGLTGTERAREIGNVLPRDVFLGGYSPSESMLALDIRSERLGREMRDIWIMDASGRERSYVTDAPGLDFQPAWGLDESLYFLSDRGGSTNIWRLTSDVIANRRYPSSRIRSDLSVGRGRQAREDVGLSGQAEQVTFFEGERVAFLRSIADGRFAFVLERAAHTVQVADAANPGQSQTVGRGENPHLSADGNHIVFESEQASGGVIGSMSRDGTRRVSLSDDLGSSGHWSTRFDLSPVGDEVVYSTVAEEGWVILAVPKSGGSPRRITRLPAREPTHPVWSPDGTTIAYASGRGLFVVSGDGGAPTRLAELRTWDTWSVRWSPNGEYIAALGWGEARGAVEPPNHVYVVPASGGQLRQLTPDDEREQKEGLEWHPNGSELTYAYRAPDFEGDGIRTAYLDGRPTTLFIDEQATWDYVGTWAPDGSAFYFLGSDEERPGWQLYRRDSSTGDVVEVASGDDLSLPNWSGDGRVMVWSVEQVRGQLWMMEVEQ